MLASVLWLVTLLQVSHVNSCGTTMLVISLIYKVAFVGDGPPSSVLKLPVDDNPNNWIHVRSQTEDLPKGVEVPLTLTENELYGTITVGSPMPGAQEQNLKVLFDTSQPDLWVISREACLEGYCTGQETSYDRTQSRTYTTDVRYFESESHGDFKVSGRVINDNIYLGGEGNRLLIKEQAFGEAVELEVGLFQKARLKLGLEDYKITEFFRGYDVVFGLKFIAPPLLYGHPDPPLYQLTRQFGKAPVFGFYINKVLPSDSKLIIGGNDEHVVVEPFFSHPVQKVKYFSGKLNPIHKGLFYNGWNIAVDRLETVNPASRVVRPLPVPPETYATLDTSTKGVLVPKRLFKQLCTTIFKYAKFRYNSDYSFKCNAAVLKQAYSVLPAVAIVFSTKQYTLFPIDYISASGDKCSLLFGRSSSSNFVVGRVFLAKYYTRFDQSNKLVQMAQAKQVFTVPLE